MRSERIASAVGLVAREWCSLVASIHPFRLTKAVPCRIDEESGARWRNRTPVAAVQRASPATDGIGQNGATRRNQTSVSALRGARSVTELWRRKWTNRRRVRSAPRGMRSHKRRPILDVHDAKHLRRDGVLGSAPSCRTGGGEALRRLKLDTSTPVRVSPRTSRANSVAAIAGRWPRRTDGCVNFSWCGLVTEGAHFVNERKRDHPSDARSLLN
jgi:hypothetical protein